MIPVCVQDDSASTILTMFDREAYGLLGISARDLAEKHTRVHYQYIFKFICFYRSTTNVIVIFTIFSAWIQFGHISS